MLGIFLELRTILNGRATQYAFGQENRVPMEKSHYCHTQRPLLCMLVYPVGIGMLVVSWQLSNNPPIQWMFVSFGLLMLILAASFHYLKVEDLGDRLSIRFGPLPLFRLSILYGDILSAETGRTTVLHGWGIHMSLKGGWVWNIWGRDCVVVTLKKGILRIGTDDAHGLTAFLENKLARKAEL